jgi:integrase
LIHIRADHPEQSVKTGKGRIVPLHPSVQEFIAFAETKDDFVFDTFPYDKNNGRIAYIGQRFGKFLREVCEIIEPQKTLYSFRHRFVDATRNAEVSEEMSKVLTGHSSGDIHGKYGRGPALKKLAEAISKVNPLADD